MLDRQDSLEPVSETCLAFAPLDRPHSHLGPLDMTVQSHTERHAVVPSESEGN
jgi:hypothetical protein